MPLSDNAKDILSFGAHGRVQDKVAEWQKASDQLADAIAQQNIELRSANERIEKLVAIKRTAVESLERIHQLSKYFTVRQRVFTEIQLSGSVDTALTKVEATLTEAELAESAVKSVAAGASTALGLWAIAGAGAAFSTGMAGTAVGISATPAVIAALSGSTLAASAGGIAAGAAVVGGAVLLPAAAIMAVFSHVSAGKKIHEIEKAIVETLMARAQSSAMQLSLQNMCRRIDEVAAATAKTQATFDQQFAQVLKRLYPLGLVSRWLKVLRRIFFGKYFSRHDLAIIAPLMQIAEMLAKLIDQKVLDEKGNIL